MEDIESVSTISSSDQFNKILVSQPINIDCEKIISEQQNNSIIDICNETECGKFENDLEECLSGLIIYDLITKRLPTINSSKGKCNTMN